MIIFTDTQVRQEFLIKNSELVILKTKNSVILNRYISKNLMKMK